MLKGKQMLRVDWFPNCWNGSSVPGTHVTCKERCIIGQSRHPLKCLCFYLPEWHEVKMEWRGKTDTCKIERKRKYGDWPSFSLAPWDFLEVLSGNTLNTELHTGKQGGRNLRNHRWEDRSVLCVTSTMSFASCFSHLQRQNKQNQMNLKHPRGTIFICFPDPLKN